MHLDLFSGIGGFALGFERAGFKTAAFVEIDNFCQRVLKKHWPTVPVYSDIKEFTGEKYAGTINIITGGYPCQPFSVAGRRRGEQDSRHLWPEMFRIIRTVRPRWVVCENVYGHIKLGFDTVAAQLEAEGYAVWPFIVPACAVGAPHQRERLWIIAHAKHVRWNGTAQPGGDEKAIFKGKEGKGGTGKFKGIHTPALVATAFIKGLQIGKQAALGKRRNEKPKRCSIFGREWWITEPSLGRVVNGIPHRVDRIRALGNAIVPQIAYHIAMSIMDYEIKMVNNDQS